MEQVDIGWAGRRVDSRYFVVLNFYCLMIAATIWLRGDHLIGRYKESYNTFIIDSH